MKVYFETYGCSLNISDTEVMKGLASEKHTIVDSPDKAEVVVINTCTVKGPTENKIMRRIKDLEKDKIVVVAGCIAQADRKRFRDYFVIGTNNLTRINDVLEKIESGGKKEQFLSVRNEKRLNLKKIRQNRYVEIVPISRGCLNSCFYCKTKFARGNLQSYDINEIKMQVECAVKDGIKEVWLTSQDNGCYGFDKKKSLAELLREITRIKGDFRIRVGMMNPQHVKKILPDLVKSFQSRKVYKFIHIPVQSGSDKILKAMNRRHTSGDFEECVARFREKFPDITVATDIIIGYPGETEADFAETIDLIKRVRPDVINCSRFWRRPGTVAAKLKEIEPAIVKSRVKKLFSIFTEIALEKNKKHIGKTYNVFIDEKGKCLDFKGRNINYKQVVVKGKNLLGKTLKVKIIDVSPIDLKGRIVKIL